MPLKLTLKPHERIVIGKAFVTNADTTTRIFVENKVPILRQKDILTEREADSPCKKIYFVVQMMYLDSENLPQYHKTYWSLVKPVLKAAPSLFDLVESISEHIITENYYKALKLTKDLIQREENLIQHAQKPS